MRDVHCRDCLAQMLAIAAVRSHNLAGVYLPSECCTPTAFDSLAVMSNLKKLHLDELMFTPGDGLTDSQSGLLLGLRQLTVGNPP